MMQVTAIIGTWAAGMCVGKGRQSVVSCVCQFTPTSSLLKKWLTKSMARLHMLAQVSNQLPTADLMCTMYPSTNPVQLTVRTSSHCACT